MALYRAWYKGGRVEERVKYWLNTAQRHLKTDAELTAEERYYLSEMSRRLSDLLAMMYGLSRSKGIICPIDLMAERARLTREAQHLQSLLDMMDKFEDGEST